MVDELLGVLDGCEIINRCKFKGVTFYKARNIAKDVELDIKVFGDNVIVSGRNHIETYEKSDKEQIDPKIEERLLEIDRPEKEDLSLSELQTRLDAPDPVIEKGPQLDPSIFDANLTADEVLQD